LSRLEDGEDSLSVDELRLQLRQKENLLTETRLEALRHITPTDITYDNIQLLGYQLFFVINSVRQRDSKKRA
jgi:hypothetical protein